MKDVKVACFECERVYGLWTGFMCPAGACWGEARTCQHCPDCGARGSVIGPSMSNPVENARLLRSQ